jgi:hypothetical protein
LVQHELTPDSRGAITVRLTAEGQERLAGSLSELGNERRRLLRILSRLES